MSIEPEPSNYAEGYHFHDANGTYCGPYTLDELTAYYRSGEINANTTIYKLVRETWLPLTLNSLIRTNRQAGLISLAQYSQRLQIPLKTPFERKASAKQKQLIWDLGYHDEEGIKALGIKQASAVISQLQAKQYQIQQTIRNEEMKSLQPIIIGVCVFLLLMVTVYIWLAS